MQLCPGYIGLLIRDINEQRDISLEIPEPLLLLIFKYFVSGTVVIQHHILCQKPWSFSTVNVLRGTKAGVHGAWGLHPKWNLEVHGLNVFKFKNHFFEKYLEITEEGMIQNVDGKGDKFCLFEYDPITKSLESIQCPGSYLAVNQDKMRLSAINKQTAPDADYAFDFEIIYLNQRVNPISIHHAFGGMLRVLPGDEGRIRGDGVLGQKDESTLWRLEWFDNERILRFRSIKTGKYLRIIPTRGQRETVVNVKGTGGYWTRFQYDPVPKTLESVHNPGWFLAVRGGNESVISVKTESVRLYENVTMQFEFIEQSATESEE